MIQILDSIPQALTDKYDQKLHAAIFLFAFSTFARIGELVCSSSEKVTDVIQLYDVFFAKENGAVIRATVCFKVDLVFCYVILFCKTLNSSKFVRGFWKDCRHIKLISQ